MANEYSPRVTTHTDQYNGNIGPKRDFQVKRATDANACVNFG